jgi:stage V sporulation protein AE
MVIDTIFIFIKAFFVGGAICTLAQLLINFTKITSGKILVYFLLSGVLLQAVGLYQYLVDFAGAGATVPICGFGYLLAKGAIEGAKKGLFDAITGGLSAASMGVATAIVFGYILSVLFKSRSKKN